MSRYRFIEAQRDHYPVRLLCQLVVVPASGYYAWQQAQQQAAGHIRATHGLRCAPNRLLDQPKPTQANQVWVSDTTYMPLANGDWAYLCAFQDMASKHVAGWQEGVTMPE
jgi:transposase InsO family protein